MADDDQSVLDALGLDVSGDYSMPDSAWGAALDAAFDPDTTTIDANLVPDMDDGADVVDDSGIDLHSSVEHHAATDHHPSGDHGSDHSTGDLAHDEIHLDDVQQDDSLHDGSGHDGVGHDGVGGHDPDEQGPHTDHPTDHDWHG